MKQLVLCADMEGASGIFDGDGALLQNGSADWRARGRACITSDALAICSAALDFGIDDILLYDGHFAGCPEFNIMREQLPRAVRVFDVAERRFDWRRIRGQAAQHPFGLITFGQHARQGTPNAYFPHTIQSPPIRRFSLNGRHIAEIGSAVLNFAGVPYLANIGCAASMAEAEELSPCVVAIPVKDKALGWEPSPGETYPLIYAGVLEALENAAQAKAPRLEPPYRFSLELCEGYAFDAESDFPWKGRFERQRAEWEAPSAEIGFELFHYARARLSKEPAAPCNHTRKDD